jgi:hypothetical protein
MVERGRYDHFYSLDELEPWVGRTKSIAEDAADAYVVTNNHNLGKSTVNALQLKSFLSGRPVDVLPTLRESYPELRQIARERQQLRPEQRSACRILGTVWHSY